MRARPRTPGLRCRRVGEILMSVLCAGPVLPAGKLSVRGPVLATAGARVETARLRQRRGGYCPALRRCALVRRRCQPAGRHPGGDGGRRGGRRHPAGGSAGRSAADPPGVRGARAAPRRTADAGLPRRAPAAGAPPPPSGPPGPACCPRRRARSRRGRRRRCPRPRSIPYRSPLLPRSGDRPRPRGGGGGRPVSAARQRCTRWPVPTPRRGRRARTRCWPSCGSPGTAVASRCASSRAPATRGC